MRKRKRNYKADLNDIHVVDARIRACHLANEYITAMLMHSPPITVDDSPSGVVMIEPLVC